MLAASSGAEAAPRHAIAMHGDPAYGPGFTHFRYANPNAPKGGSLTQGIAGTFDSINPFVLRGNPFQQVRGYVVESLMVRSQDEPFTLYALIANAVETDDARSFVAFTIDPRARFSDGTPVTADDVLFSWKLLREKGRPNHRLYYGKVIKAAKIGPDKVRFDFGDSGDRELPLILALLPVLPAHATDATQFDEPSLTPLTGSGPYRVSEVRAGSYVVLKRDPNYWGAALAVNRGQYNFDELRFEFYRDTTSWFEAFKRKLYDFRLEEDPSRWAIDYDFPLAKSGGLVREDLETQVPAPMMALVFNTRRSVFSDARVREALIELFDFEWMNAKLFHALYARTGSFFDGSSLSARGIPASEAEWKLLAPFAKEILPEVMKGNYQPPRSNGSGHDRTHIKKALALFAEAGWVLRDGALVNKETGAPFRFEILVTKREDERIATIFTTMLRAAGVAAEVRLVEGGQFEARRQQYDYDMIPATWQQSLSPGNEQYFYFGSASADQTATRNYMGMKSAAADAMIEAMLRARTTEELTTASRALDRVLISGRYVIPLYHLPKQWLARWPEIERPSQLSFYGALPETWWRKEARP
ncbi:MAG: ABC transporter substrate-binding protein [Xanthobacteraceae bacterium]|nr:ABC transporter substrate-binding protein [Xanthobacteraceae bacterium]